jgi:cardiolipin synthase
MPVRINLPNLFTLLRLLLTPLVAWAILVHRPVLAMGLFALAAFTDYLDGAAARGLRSATPAGAVLDPIADKFLLNGVFLALAVAGMLPWWLVAVVLGRDLYILVGAGAILLTTSIRRFPPSIWGKVSTCVQIGTVLAWLVRNIWAFRLLAALAAAGVWICAAFTVWSGIHYTWRAVRSVRALPRNAPPAPPRHTH